MKTNLIVFFFLITQIPIAKSQEVMMKYYSHLVFRETPYAPIKGRIPLSKKQKINRNHFEISFDSLGRIKLLKYCFGIKPISLKRLGFMNGAVDLSPIVKIRYEAGQEIRNYFDEEENPIENDMGVYESIYEYNNEGKRIGLKYFDKMGKPVNNSWGIHEYSWHHIDNKSVLEKRKNNQGEAVPIRPFYKFWDVIYTYNEKNLLVSMRNVDENYDLLEEETGTAIDMPTYDSQHNLIEFKFYDSQRKNIIGSFYDASGGVIEYDNWGHMTSYKTIDLDGNPRIGTKSWAIIECKFDEYGNLIHEQYFDEKGTPAQRKGAISITYEYAPNDPTLRLSTKQIHY